MQACAAVGMVPHTFEGVYGRDMVSTDHMQKARVRKFHTVAYRVDPTLKGTRLFEHLLEGLSFPHLSHVKEHEKLCRSH